LREARPGRLPTGSGRWSRIGFANTNVCLTPKFDGGTALRPHTYSKPAHIYARRGGVLSLIGRGFVAALRLILPVLALLIIAFGADLSSDQPIVWLDRTFRWMPPADHPSAWLTTGHLIYPLTYFALNLISRRYGMAYAGASLALSWIFLAGFAIWFSATLGMSLPEMSGISYRVTAAFVVVAIVSGMVNIAVYEITRGFPWWRAPFYASLAAALTFSLLFFPIAFVGSDIAWANRMLIYCLILMAASFLSLFPYLALKTIFRPMKGLGYAPD